MRKRFKPKFNSNHEFELDLAPLLAVMVKLVPVLLISSAFVQVMSVETELPQAVKEAVQKQEDDKSLASVQLSVSSKEGIKVIIAKDGQQKTDLVPLKADGSFDLPALHKEMQKVKAENPKVFRIELAPEGDVAYKELVKIMDETRKSRDSSVRFPVWDSQKNQNVETDYMFPDVVFSNMMEG